ncbi:MAG: OmpA family protein [Deltaproteobacteria bacterium]|nr:OmpA family protein [Deltaproteobacteria bacterium]
MRRVAHRALLVLSLLSATLLSTAFAPSTASAQLTGNGLTSRGDVGLGMDLQLFRPAMDSKGYLSVNGTDILGHLDFSFGLIVNGGFGLVPFTGFHNDSTVAAADIEGQRCPSGILCGRAVDYVFTGILHANLGLANILEVGLQIPIGFSSGPNLTIPGILNDYDSTRAGQGIGYQGFGNLIVHSKLRILRAERNGGFGLGVGLQVEFPTGNAQRFVGDNTIGLWPMVLGEYRVDRYVRFGLQVGARLFFGDTPTIPVGGRTELAAGVGNTVCGRDMMNGMTQCSTTGGSNVSYGPYLTYGLGAGFRLGDSPLELTAEIYGGSIFQSIGQTGGNSLEAMGGLKIFVERNSYLVLSGGGAIPISGLLSADVRGMVGFIFEPSIGDRDGDGYRDDTDQCPDEPEDFDNFGDEDGCPDPDNDRDGILDVDDECPMVPEDRDGDSDEDGCPEGNEGDRDGDGILDADDQCPDDPEDRDGFQDEDGCPDPDNDQDGILDVDDLCPNDPEDRDGFQDEDGCPDPDNDADRILDRDDSCPNDPETYNGTEDEDGCPDRGSVIVTDEGIIILEKIYFETDSAVIMERSYPIVDAVATTLINNPQIQYIEIQGHADERSSDEYNIRLTTDRAAAVLEALVQRGVARDRMRSGGYGERCPLDPRHTPEAWEQNRRVEFKILRTTDGPTGVEVACPAGRDLVPSS